MRVPIQMLIDVGNCPVAELQVWLPDRLLEQPPQCLEMDLIRLVDRFKAEEVHLLVQLVLNINKALAIPVNQVELKVGLYAKKHFEIERELISHTLLVGHIDVKIFVVLSEKRFRNSTHNPLFILLSINKSSKSLIEVDEADVHVFRELVLIEELDALSLSVDIPETLFDLAVKVLFAVRADVSEVIFLYALKQ